ncbi:RXFP1-like protein [Mya arenaria]|uniref:RXFP1-like protein n=1 Tax=Mya arenaria TaxID=6604 RepID=A0ABY7DP52_MYAAR|nr:RXFP1-like protein [Mya arenaria]
MGKSTEVLDLSNGAFKNTSIKNDTFTLANTNVDNVTKLDLSGNRITDVDVESFNALFNLKVLILANNSIEHLNNETFTSLRKLEELDVLTTDLRNCEPVS